MKSVEQVHNSSTYTNRKCHCDVCRADWARASREMKAKRAVQRVLVDGRLIHPGCVHGRESSYVNYQCRCAECTESHRYYRGLRRARAKALAAAENKGDNRQTG